MNRKNLPAENPGTDTESEGEKGRKHNEKQDLKIDNVNIDPSKLKATPNLTKIKTIITRHNNRIRLQLSANDTEPFDALQSKITPLNGKICFSYEEVTGTRTEYPIAISDPGDDTGPLPGAVFSGNDLLEKGRFVYQGMKRRKTITLSTGRSPFLRNTSSQAVSKPDEDLAAELHTAANALIHTSNFTNVKPEKEVLTESAETTIEDYLGVQIAPSGFFMCQSGGNGFSLTSPKKNYFYMFSFGQKCMDINAGKINTPEDIFAEKTDAQSDWFYIEQVGYGRQLHVIFESGMRLDKYGATESGSLNWEKFNSRLSAEPDDSSFLRQISVKAHATGGAPYLETNPKKIKAAVEGYFAEPFCNFPIAPLYFKATDLKGKPISLQTEVFLKQKRCLETRKLRVGLKSIAVLPSENGAHDGYVHLSGSLSIYVYDDREKVVLANGKKMPSYLEALDPPTTMIRYGDREHSLRLKPGMTVDQTSSVLNNKFVNLTVKNLHNRIKIYTKGREVNDFSGNFKKESDCFDKTLGQLLQEGVFEKTLFLNEGIYQVEITVEISAY